MRIQFPLLSPALEEHFRKRCSPTVTVQKESRSNGQSLPGFLEIRGFLRKGAHVSFTYSRTAFVQVSSCQVLGLSWAPRGKFVLVHINHVNYILFVSGCFRNKHVLEFWPMR